MDADSLMLPLDAQQAVSLADLPLQLFQRLAIHPINVLRIDGKVKAGFPSPADGLDIAEIDLNRELIRHPQATFLVRASGPSMVLAGIHDGDMLLVDRAIDAQPGHIVIGIIDNDFTVKYLRRRAGKYFLEAANPTFPPIIPRNGQTLKVFGVVTSSITRFLR